MDAEATMPGLEKLGKFIDIYRCLQAILAQQAEADAHVRLNAAGGELTNKDVVIFMSVFDPDPTL